MRELATASGTVTRRVGRFFSRASVATADVLGSKAEVVSMHCVGRTDPISDAKIARSFVSVTERCVATNRQNSCSHFIF